MRSRRTEGTEEDNDVKEPHSSQKQLTLKMSDETETHTGRGKWGQTPEATSCLGTCTLQERQSEWVQTTAHCLHILWLKFVLYIPKSSYPVLLADCESRVPTADLWLLHSPALLCAQFIDPRQSTVQSMPPCSSLENRNVCKAWPWRVLRRHLSEGRDKDVGHKMALASRFRA